MKIAADNMKLFGDTELLCCPRCKNMVNMKILRASAGVGLLGVSLYDYKVDLFTICPACSSLFAVNEEVSKTAGKKNSNKTNSISEMNITFVKDLNFNNKIGI